MERCPGGSLSIPPFQKRVGLREPWNHRPPGGTPRLWALALAVLLGWITALPSSPALVKYSMTHTFVHNQQSTVHKSTPSRQASTSAWSILKRVLGAECSQRLLLSRQRPGPTWAARYLGGSKHSDTMDFTCQGVAGLRWTPWGAGGVDLGAGPLPGGIVGLGAWSLPPTCAKDPHAYCRALL